MDNVLWLTASHRSIGGKDLTGSIHTETLQSPPSVLSETSLSTVWHNRKNSAMFVLPLSTCIEKSAAVTILTVLLMTLHTVKVRLVRRTHVNHGRYPCQPNGLIGDLQVLGNTDKMKRLSESDTRAALCPMTGLRRGSPDRHGSADLQVDILTWISCLPGHRHPDTIPRWLLIRSITGQTTFFWRKLQKHAALEQRGAQVQLEGEDARFSSHIQIHTHVALSLRFA